MSGDVQKYFFVHVMKVGGFSLLSMIIRDVVREQRHRFPTPLDGTDALPLMKYETLRRGIERRGHEIRLFAGHYPYAAVHAMGPDVKTFALFRDPVERTISHIKHMHRTKLYRNLSPETVYEKAFAPYFDNLQLRMFSVSSIEKGDWIFDRTALAEENVERALEHVRHVDVIGLTAEFSEFLRGLETTFGWRFGQVLRVNQSPSLEIPSSLRERISEDLKLDKIFYDEVVGIYERRKGALVRPARTS